MLKTTASLMIFHSLICPVKCIQIGSLPNQKYFCIIQVNIGRKVWPSFINEWPTGSSFSLSKFKLINQTCITQWSSPQPNSQIDGLVQKRHNSSALAMEWRLSCTNPSKRKYCINYVLTVLSISAVTISSLAEYKGVRPQRSWNSTLNQLYFWLQKVGFVEWVLKPLVLWAQPQVPRLHGNHQMDFNLHILC